jgi:hypothetical protein
MIHLDGAMKTDELSLATVLVLNGYAPIMERADKGVVWVIRRNEVDDLLEEILEDFRSGGCRVEPRRFMRELRVVREDMYKFLGTSPVQRTAVA